MRFTTSALWLATALISSLALAQSTQSTQPADLNKPTLITLKLKEVAQQQVFDEIAKQCGNVFSTQPADLWQKRPGSPITVEWESRPFWLAVRDACGKAGLSLKHPIDSAKPQIILARDNQDWTTYPAVTSGAFLVNLIGLQRSATVDMRKPSEIQRQFYAKFSLFCEPRIRLLRGSLIAKVDAATDDKGNSLISPDADTESMTFITSWVHTLEARLLYPKNAGTTIKTLHCSAKFTAQIQSETIEISDPIASKNVTRSVAGRKITIREVRRASDEWEAVVTFARDQLTPEQWAGSLFPGNSLKLIDTDGRSIAAHGFGMGTKGEEASFIFKFEKDSLRGPRFGKPAKLTWEIPTQTVQIPLEWEFKDLPIPN